MSRCGVRGLFYTLARLLDDVSAIHKGSRAIVRRLERLQGHRADAGEDV